MLSGISKSEAVARGKSTCEMSQLMRKENYTIGIKEWERPIGSVYHYQFLNRKPDPTVFKPQHPSTSQVVISHEHSQTTDKLKNHFLSECGKSFVKYADPQRVKPVLGAKELSQSKYVEASMNYGFKYGQETKSTSQALHNLKDPSTVPNVHWKQQRERFNPITNEVYNQVKVMKASQFDFFNDQRKKDRQSHNFSAIPKPNERIDIITGRRLPPF